MATEPAPPESEPDFRAALTAVAASLLRVHRLLIDLARDRFERERGAVPGPGALLQLLINDPFFAWLRPLSGAMVELDTLLDKKAAITVAEASAARIQVERLLNGSGAGAETFSPSYLELLPEHPELVIEHGGLRQALRRLPGAAEPPPR